ncbi:MAG: pyruvate kinase [Deltaproteobacteria bacterium]|nr:pyruvate kinase [Deltaproteobacteria bacterium]
MRKAKIVATLGPASSSADRIGQLVAAGLDVARLNFSHGTHDDHAALFQRVRAAAAEAGRHVAVLADLCGPKLRLGQVREGGVTLERGHRLEIAVGADPGFVGDAQRVGCSYEPLSRDLRPGDRLLVDDGRIELRAIEPRPDALVCEVVVGGQLTSKKGLNLPGARLSAPALTAKDLDDLRFAAALGVDYFALSFVRRAADVAQAKAAAGDIPVIAKIEKPEALVDLDAILDVADGIMVARGDLGVEAGQEKVPLLQKRLIVATNRRGKAVITATQMLESMTHSPTPTRAEVSDVANAILDGTDAVMLSGETAAGDYPVEALRQMDAIIREVESSELYASLAPPQLETEASFSTAVADAAVRAASDMELAAIAVYSETGHSASVVSEFRPRAAIVALSRHPRVLNRLALHWGVLPLQSAWVDSVDGLVAQAEQLLLQRQLVRPGQNIAITFGMERGSFSRTDTLKLRSVGGAV